MTISNLHTASRNLKVLPLPHWQISVADLFEFIRPTGFTLSALASACVLADARHTFRPPLVIAWTLGALLLPFTILPLYLAARLFTPRRADQTPPHRDTLSTQTPASDASTHVAPHFHAATDAPEQHDSQQPSHDSQQPLHDASQSSSSRLLPTRRGVVGAARGAVRAVRRILHRAMQGAARLKLPALYLLALLVSGGIYFYREQTSVEGHLARAENAKLARHQERAISEYRAALRLEDDPHTHKLLALELAEAGRYEEALAEFLAAERGGEPDAEVYFRIGLILEALGRRTEAARYYRRFLQTPLCTQTLPVAHCAAALARVETSGEVDFKP